MAASNDITMSNKRMKLDPSGSSESSVLAAMRAVFATAVQRASQQQQLPSLTALPWRDFYFHRITSIDRIPGTTHATPTVIRQYHTYKKQSPEAAAAHNPQQWAEAIAQHAQAIIPDTPELASEDITLHVPADQPVSRSRADKKQRSSSNQPKRSAGIIDISIPSLALDDTTLHQQQHAHQNILSLTQVGSAAAAAPVNGNGDAATGALPTGKAGSFFQFTSLGTLRSCYKLKYSTPRQGSLCPLARGTFTLHKHITATALDGIEEYSHLWLIFVFHENDNKTFHAHVSPPKHSAHVDQQQASSNGAARKVGVFASRTPHRVNPIGMTLVKLDKRIPRSATSDGRTLQLSGIDLIDGTPILDIKPVHDSEMMAMSDPNLRMASWLTQQVDVRLPVSFTDTAMEQLKQVIDQQQLEFYHSYEEIYQAIHDTVSLDPRESYVRRRGDPNASWGFVFDNLNIIYRVKRADSNNVGTEQSEVAEVLECQYIDAKRIAQLVAENEQAHRNGEAEDETFGSTDTSGNECSTSLPPDQQHRAALHKYFADVPDAKAARHREAEGDQVL